MFYRRPIRLGVLTLFLLGLAATQAAAWGPAVHAYVADHAGRCWPFLNRIEMYGSTLPDLCYFVYPPGDVQTVCATVIHDDFYMAMWDEAFNLRTRALGYGYESHHEADITAHLDGITIPGPGGYVTQKAWIFSVGLAATLAGELDRYVDPTEVEPLAHNLIEAGTDVLVTRFNPLIASKLTLAALLRGSFVPEQLAAVYKDELAGGFGILPTEAASALAEAEGEFRTAMVIYGLALMKDQQKAISTLAELLAALAPPAFLEEYLLKHSREELVSLISGALTLAIDLCDDDFQPELLATTSAVRDTLAGDGIGY